MPLEISDPHGASQGLICYINHISQKTCIYDMIENIYIIYIYYIFREIQKCNSNLNII